MASIKPVLINASGEVQQAQTGDTVPVDYGGTGLASLTANSYLRAVSNSAFELRTPAQVLSDIGALSTTGTAASATVLATARTINGTSFNGSANITTSLWGTARTLTIGSTGKSVNGSANVSWTLAEIGAASTSDLTGRVQRGTLQLNADGTAPATFFSEVSDTLALKYSNNTTGSTGYPSEFGATLSVIMEKQSTRSFDLHMPTNSANFLYFRGYSSAGTPTEWKSIGALQNINTWTAKQTFSGGLYMSNDVLLEYGSGGATIRGSSTGSIIVASGSTAGAGIRLRPNGDTNLTGQVAIDTDGIVVATGFSGPLTGNATTATTLATARTINGTSFNGSANITTSNWGTARTLTIGSTGKSVNGSANVSWSLAEIGAAAASDVTTLQTSIGGDNQIANGNFFTGTTVGWTSGNGGIGSATITRSIVDSTLSSASKAYRMDIANLATTGYFEAVSNSQIKAAKVQAGEPAIASIYARGTAGVRVFVQIRWNDSTGAAISYSGTPSNASYLTSETWTKYTHTAVAPANAVTANVHVRVYGNTAADQWFEFGNVSLQIGSITTGYAPSIDELRNDFNNLITTPNVWNQMQTFNGAFTLPNNKIALIGAGGGNLRGTDTGSIVLSTGTGSSGYFYIRPNGDTSTSFQTVFYSSGNVDMPTVRAGVSTPNADGAVLIELVTERSWQFRQKGTGATTQLELFDMTGAKSLVMSNASNSNVIVFSPTTSTISASTFTGSLSGNAATATKLATARTINGVAFDGTANISITAAVSPDLYANTVRVQPNAGDQIYMRAEGTSGVTIDAVNSDNSSYANLSIRGTSIYLNSLTFINGNLHARGDQIFLGGKTANTGNKIRVINPDTTTTVKLDAVTFDASAFAPMELRATSFTFTTGRIGFNAHLNSTTTAAVLSATRGGTIYLRPNGADNDSQSTVIDSGGSMEIRGFLRLRGNGRNFQIYDNNNDTACVDIGAGIGTGTDRGGYVINRNAGGELSLWGRNGSVRLRLGAGPSYSSLNSQLLISMGSSSNPNDFNTAALLTTGNYGGIVGMKDNAGAGTYFGGMYLGSGYLYIGVGGANSNAPGGTTRFDPSGEVRFPNQIYLNSGWFRSQQSGTGWYSEPHGGGIFMQDNSWVRVYNNKGFLVSGANIRIEGGSPTIECYDSDENYTNWIHCNSGNHGFLQHNAFAWGCYRNSSNDWVCQNNIIAYASDRRLKKNIVDAPGEIVENFFENVRIRQFDWDEEKIALYKVGIKPRTGEVGAVAQEMQAVYADAVAVNEAHNQIKTKDNPNPMKPDILTIDWTKTVPLLIAEVQNLRRRVKYLEAQL